MINWVNRFIIVKISIYFRTYFDSNDNLIEYCRIRSRYSNSQTRDTDLTYLPAAVYAYNVGVITLERKSG